MKMNYAQFILTAFLLFTTFLVCAQPKEKAQAAYTIFERGRLMTRVNIIKDIRAKGNSVQIEVLNVSGGTARVQGPDMLGAEITDVLATVGNYNRIQEISKTGRGHTTQLQEVFFPLRLRITISNQILEVELKDSGFWKISVGMNQ